MKVKIVTYCRSNYITVWLVWKNGDTKEYLIHNIITSDRLHHNTMIKLKIQDLVLCECFGCEYMFNN